MFAADKKKKEKELHHGSENARRAEPYMSTYAERETLEEPITTVPGGRLQKFTAAVVKVASFKSFGGFWGQISSP